MWKKETAVVQRDGRDGIGSEANSSVAMFFRSLARFLDALRRKPKPAAASHNLAMLEAIRTAPTAASSNPAYKSRPFYPLPERRSRPRTAA